MSAFIVAPGCINSIVTYLNYHATWFGWLVTDHGFDVTRTEDLHRLAEALYQMNCAAVDQRYGEGTAAKDEAEAPGFTFHRVVRSSVAVHKAACCLQYQCAEGGR